MGMQMLLFVGIVAAWPAAAEEIPPSTGSTPPAASLTASRTPLSSMVQGEVDRHARLARAYQQRGQKARAREEYDLVLRLDPENEQARSAISALDRPATSSGAQGEETMAEADAALAVGETAYRESRLADAEGNARRVIELVPGGVPAVRARALLATIQEERFQSETTPLGEYSEDVRALYEEGMKLYRAGKLREASDRLRQARALAPTHVQVCRMDERVRAAAEAAERRVTRAASVSAAATAEAGGDWPAAVAAWAQIASQDSADAEARAGLARAEGTATAVAGRALTGRKAAARQKYEEGLQLDAAGRNQEARLKWKEALQLDSQLTEALDKLRGTRRPPPRFAPSPTASAAQLASQATETWRAGKRDDAIQMWKAAVATDPGNEQAKRDLQRAETAMREANGDSKQDAENHYRRGLSFFQDGKYDDARGEFQQALFLDPGHAAAEDGVRHCDAVLGR